MTEQSPIDPLEPEDVLLGNGEPAATVGKERTDPNRDDEDDDEDGEEDSADD